MRSEPIRNRHAGGQKLEAGDAMQAGFEPLMHFEFTRPAPDAEHPGLEFLGGSLQREFWWTDAEVVAGQDHGLAWRQAGDLLFMACEAPDDGQADSVHLARESYALLLKLAAERGCPHLLRAWNFMPAINAGRRRPGALPSLLHRPQPGLDGCRRGCPELPAGTAIGGDDPHLRIMLLCGAVPGINIENPRQVSAYHYPRNTVRAARPLPVPRPAAGRWRSAADDFGHGQRGRP
jgi:chorismate lyase / 3-hydroxybenzoate synthase